MENISSLQHIGIPGMKWGRRKGTTVVAKKPVNTSDDHQTKIALKRKKISEMSNAELKKFNERLQLERQYKDLSKKDVSRGQEFVTSIFKEVAKETAKSYAKKYGVQGIEKVIGLTKKLNG